MDEMLDLNSETICFIIARAREFHAKEAVMIPDEPGGMDGDWAREVLEDHLSDMTFQEVKSAIEDLEPDQQISLVALMWLGRGDFTLEEWPAALEEAQRSWTERTADYLLATPMVADYLDEGLAQFGHSCE